MACTFHLTATDLQFYTGVLLHILIDVLYISCTDFVPWNSSSFFFPFIFWPFPHSWYFLSLTHSNCSMGLSLISRGFSPRVLHHFAPIWTGCFQELPYDLEIPLLGLYPRKVLIWKDAYTAIFTAALFTILKTCKQSKCLSINERIKKVW